MNKGNFIKLSVIMLVMAHNNVLSGSLYAQESDKKNILQATQNAILDGEWSVAVDMQKAELLANARYLKNKIRDLTGMELVIEGLPASVKKKNIFLSLDVDKLTGICGPVNTAENEIIAVQGYVIDICENAVSIRARTGCGIFYGIQAILQNIIREKSGYSVQTAHQADYPKVRWRGAHFCGIDEKNIYNYLDRMAEMRLNMAVFESWDFFRLDDFSVREKMKKIFDYARSLYIEPVPQLSTFSHVAPILKKDPNCAEGMQIKDALFCFKNGAAEPVFPNKVRLVNVLITDKSKLLVKAKDTGVIYKEGFDYEIASRRAEYPYRLTNMPLVIKRIPQGRIKDREEVLISFNYMDRENELASYCPSEENTYAIVSAALKNVCEYLKPSYIHLGHDEITVMNTDSRCRERKLTHAQLLADEISRLYDIIKKINPDCKIMLWDDMLNPWHNGGNKNFQLQWGGVPGETASAIDAIPKGVDLVCWWYEEKDALSKMKNSPSYYSSKGVGYFVSPWNDTENIRQWLLIIKGHPECKGIIITNWKGWDKNKSNIQYMAGRAWGGM